jgi:hypothetical protein
MRLDTLKAVIEAPIALPSVDRRAHHTLERVKGSCPCWAHRTMSVT